MTKIYRVNLKAFMTYHYHAQAAKETETKIHSGYSLSQTQQHCAA